MVVIIIVVVQQLVVTDQIVSPVQWHPVKRIAEHFGPPGSRRRQIEFAEATKDRASGLVSKHGHIDGIIHIGNAGSSCIEGQERQTDSGPQRRVVVE